VLSVVRLCLCLLHSWVTHKNYKWILVKFHEKIKSPKDQPPRFSIRSLAPDLGIIFWQIWIELLDVWIVAHMNVIFAVLAGWQLKHCIQRRSEMSVVFYAQQTLKMQILCFAFWDIDKMSCRAVIDVQWFAIAGDFDSDSQSDLIHFTFQLLGHDLSAWTLAQQGQTGSCQIKPSRTGSCQTGGIRRTGQPKVVDTQRQHHQGTARQAVCWPAISSQGTQTSIYLLVYLLTLVSKETLQHFKILPNIFLKLRHVLYGQRFNIVKYHEICHLASAKMICGKG